MDRSQSSNKKLLILQADTVIHNLLAVVIYLAAAILSFKLIVPPSDAVALWLPAGVAVGAVLAWGLGCLPGIFIAALLTVLYFSPVSTAHFSGFSFYIVAFLLALSSVVQAWFAYWLVKKYLGLENKLHYTRDIIVFMILIGPIAGVVNSTGCSMVLFFFGGLPNSALFLHLGLWWVGDSLGALFAAPMFLICFAKPRAVWRLRAIQILLPALLTFIVVIIVFLVISQAEMSRVRFMFAKKVTQNVEKTSEWLVSAGTLSHALAAHLEHTPTIDSHQFTEYVRRLLQNHPYVQAVEWVPKITNRSAFQKEHNLVITEKRLGKLIASRTKSQYFPVLYVYPKSGNKKVIGFDLSSNPPRARAIQKAAQLSTTVMSEPVKLVQSENKSLGVLLFTPVYRGGHLAGFSLIVLNVSNFMRNLFPDRWDYYQVILSDATYGADGNLLYHFQNKQAKPRSVTNMVYFTQRLKLDGRDWRIVATSSQEYFNSEYSWRIWLFLLGGLLFCVLLNLVLFVLFGQKHVVQKQVEEQTKLLREEESKNLLILNSAGEGIYGVDLEGCTVFVNSAACQLLGYSEAELLGKNMHDCIHHAYPNGDKYPVEHCPILNTINTGKEVRMRDEVFWRKDGTSFWVEYNATPTRVNDEVTGAVVVFADVSDRRESEIQLEKMARFDLLTGLPNRANFLDTLERAVVRAERTNASLAVCLFDIDNFKQINDNFGHEMGDELLKALPEVLKNVLRGVDYLARLGGDEFGLIVEDFGSAVEVGAIVGRYITTISEPIFIGSDEINTTVSVGVAIHPSAGKTAQELIKNADIAMYKAKEDGKNKLSFFNTEISTQIKRQHKVDMAMRKAVVNNEFYLLYQPQVDIETNQLVGVEALVRWDNPSLETTSPAEFIPMAEENGLILEIGEWVLQQAVKDSLWLNENIKEGLKVSINVSVRQLERDDFAQSVSAIFNRYGVDSRQIYLEVTETALMQHSERIVATMSLLDQMGVRFALDDFGMGYSSMHYLKRMPISLIKIDQNFVRDIASDAGDAAIVRAIIDLAHAMNIPTIAEGVEENGQLLQLLEYGCEQVQGYYFAKPMRIDDLHEWYLKRQGKVTE